MTIQELYNILNKHIQNGSLSLDAKVLLYDTELSKGDTTHYTDARVITIIGGRKDIVILD